MLNSTHNCIHKTFISNLSNIKFIYFLFSLFSIYQLTQPFFSLIIPVLFYFFTYYFNFFIPYRLRAWEKNMCVLIFLLKKHGHEIKQIKIHICIEKGLFSFFCKKKCFVWIFSYFLSPFLLFYELRFFGLKTQKRINWTWTIFFILNIHVLSDVFLTTACNGFQFLKNS